MITIQNTFDAEGSYPLARLGDPASLLFFDIETTGFSGDFCTVYLIGCVFYKEGRAHFIQWFADTKASEAQVIQSFFSFLKDYSVLVHFNGDTFDIPFLMKRCRALKLPCDFSGVESVDIYKRIKPWKKHLGLENLKQKTIEGFLSICREDHFDGGQLISVYEDYLKTRDENLLRLLLLHNEEDLKGTPSHLPPLIHPAFFTQDCPLRDLKKAAGETPRLLLSLKGEEATVLPRPLCASGPSYGFAAAGNALELSIRLYEGTLKYYYPNYKDYYYLIYEDTAVHKSVGEYVDRDARIKATKETCYTKKSGIFLPQPEPVWTPEFKTSSKDRTGFFEFSPSCFQDPVRLNQYIKKIWAELF